MSTTTKSEKTLTSRLSEVKCPLATAQLAPLEGFFNSKLKSFGSAVAELVRSAVADCTNFRSRRLDEFLAAIIAGLKSSVSLQKSAIMGHADFVKLESTNKSVEEVVFHKEGAGVKKRVLNLGVRDLMNALANANGLIEMSSIYGPMCRHEFHRPGGKPNKYTLLLDDVGPEHSDLLQALSGVGREGHAPVLSSIKPVVLCPQDPSSDEPPANFCGLPTQPQDIAAEYGKPENAPLRGVQSSPDATHMALTVGKVIGRAPYHPLRNPAPRSESFVESNPPLMIPSQVLLAKSLNESFTKFKTGVRSAGVHSGGKHKRPTVVTDGQVRTTEIEVDEIQDMAIGNCGFISYLPWKYQNFVVNFSTPSAFVPVPSGDPTSDADSIVASQLPFVMLSCQFGQLLKSKLREVLGQTVNERTIHAQLCTEFNKYVTPDLNSVDQATLARKPLAKFNIVVTQTTPGVFNAVAQIQPHPMFKGAVVTMTLKAEVSPSKP